MSRFEPYSLRMQISRMYERGESFFCTAKVQDWLKEHQEDPSAYDIIFHAKPAPPNLNLRSVIEIELRRKDGQPVAAELQEDINYSS